METGYEEEEDEQNEMQRAWTCTTFIGGLATNRRAFHSSPSHTPHPAHHLILPAWLSQHFPDMTLPITSITMVAIQATYLSLSHH